MAGLLLPRVIYGISSIASYTLRQEENKNAFHWNVNRPLVDYMGYVMKEFEHMCVRVRGGARQKFLVVLWTENSDTKLFL